MTGSINVNACIFLTPLGWCLPTLYVVMTTEPVSIIVYSLLNRRCWMMSRIQTYLKIIRIALKMGRKNVLPYHSCSCHGPTHIAFQAVLAMGGNIKNNVKRFVSNINLYVMS